MQYSILLNVWTHFEERSVNREPPVEFEPQLTSVIVFSITVIALCRFMLNLRGVYISRASMSNTPGLSTEDDQADLRLVSYIVGNLGAPVDVATASAAAWSPPAEDASDAARDIVVPRDPLAAGLSQESCAESIDMVQVSA